MKLPPPSIPCAKHFLSRSNHTQTDLHLLNEQKPTTTINANTCAKESRLAWVDSLRGLCMFLVVFMHIDHFSIGNTLNDSVVMQFIFNCFLTTFFFISGYVSFKGKQTEYKDLFRSLLNKAKKLLIPLFIFYSLNQVAMGTAFSKFSNEGFEGYWFLLVLFEIFLVYYTVKCLCKVFGLNNSEIVLLPLCLVFYILPYSVSIQPRILTILSYSNFSSYFPFFVIGLVSRRYNVQFMSLVKNKYIFLFSLLSLLIGQYFIASGHNADLYMAYGKLGVLLGIVIKYISTFLLVSLFSTDSKFSILSTTVDGYLQKIGKRTLEIYVLHWFLIPSLDIVYPLLSSSSNIVLEVLFVSFISYLVIWGSMLLGNILSESELLEKYILSK